VTDDPGTTDEAYRTVAGRGTASFEVRGSEFIGHVASARTVDAAESVVAEIRAEYDDATHNVPAYRVRADPFREWASDDGEPSGSAGGPALNVLQQEEIENVVAVVTRYYGGTNLGVGGLARTHAPSRTGSTPLARPQNVPRSASRSPSTTTTPGPSAGS
jgi:putative IMPACT (imprinted ancient) family translation regulator